MAITGNLKDLNLSSLAQILCLEKRKAVIVLKHRGQEGKIFFESGDAAHASVGTLNGEDAFYQLVTWSDADFRLSDFAVLPQKSIHAPLSHLLMEAMRRIDEHEIHNGEIYSPHQLLSPKDIERDSTLESELISLLSNLEHIRALLSDRKKTNKPEMAIQHLCEILNRVSSFTQRINVDGGIQLSLSDIAFQESVKYPHLLTLQFDRDIETDQIEVSFAQNEQDTFARSQSYRQISPGIMSLLDTFFNAFLKAFRSSNTADQWNETITNFLTDLSTVVNGVQF